jgi:hypothetical protein
MPQRLTGDCETIRRLVGIMAPSFDNLTEDNGTYDSEEEIDFSGASTIALYRHAWLTIT